MTTEIPSAGAEWFLRRHHCYDGPVLGSGRTTTMDACSRCGHAAHLHGRSIPYCDVVRCNCAGYRRQDGSPMTENETLDKINGLWAEAKQHEAAAALHQDEARNERYQAEDLFAEAEELFKPLLASHPDWREAMVLTTDPRVES